MSATDYQQLKLKQTELFVAQQIFEELSQRRVPDFYIDQLPLRNIGDEDYTFRDFHYQRTGLERLVAKNLIQILNADQYLKIGIHVHVVDLVAFRNFYTDLFESIPANGYGARIVYSTKTGRGKLDGKTFKLNHGRNRRVFEYIAKRPNQYLTKQKLWVIAGEKGKFDEDDTDNVIVFNTVITTLREALKNISAKHLRLKRRVILDAEVTLTD